MIQDEYNSIDVKNEKLISKAEFGKIQKIEYSDNGDMYLQKSSNTVNLNESSKHVNVETVNASVVPSASSASAIAAGSTSAIVAASTVAITAISVATGISVALHDYQYKFESFIISANELSYDLVIRDLKQEEESEKYNYKYQTYNKYEGERLEEEENPPLTLRVYNNRYDSSQDLWLGYNSGVFSGLTLGDTYNIVLSESRYGGQIIYEEKFVTVEHSSFIDFNIEEGLDYYHNTAYVTMDFVDDTNTYSDFVLTLSSSTHTVTFELPKQSGTQELELLANSGERVELNTPYTYSFSFNKNNEREIFKEGEVIFYDLYSEFHEFVFDKTANYVEGSFIVRLDYYDEFEVAFDNFVLTFFYEGDENYGMEIELDTTTEEQVIHAVENDISLSNTYNYKLTCTYYDVPMELDRGEVTFSDNSGALEAIEFRGFELFNAANYDTREISYQLDFTDELYYLYGFELTIHDLETGNSETIYPEHNTEIQTYLLDATSGLDEYDNPVYLIDIKNDPIQYSFKYWHLDEEIEFIVDEDISFENSLKSVFLDIESTFDFINEAGDSSAMLPIRLVYDDAAHEYSYFSVDVAVNDTHISYLSFEGDNVKTDWQYCVWYPDDGVTTVDAVIDTTDEVKVRVATMLPETPEHPYAEEVIIYEEVVNFTKNTSTDNILGVYLLGNTITNGNYDIGFYPVYTGSADNFECQIIFETNTGKTYTCNYFVPAKGNYAYALLTEAEESLDEENFATDFSSGVTITLRYCTITYSTGSGSDPEPIKSDYIEKVLYENFMFEISV